MRQVPVLPVVLPVAALAFALLLVWLSRRTALSLPRVVVALGLCVYGAGVVAHTVFPIYLDRPVNEAGWRAFVTLTPLIGYGSQDALTNVCVFVPLGMLVSLAAPRMSRLGVIAVCAALSLGIELTQWVTAVLLGGGHIADANDLGFNVVGGAIGVALISALAARPTTRGLVDRFRWPPPVRPEPVGSGPVTLSQR